MCVNLYVSPVQFGSKNFFGFLRKKNVGIIYYGFLLNTQIPNV